MEDIFIRLLNVSITAGYLVLAVMALRLIFRKAPKWLFCVLWALVGIRLVLPVSLESVYSLIPATETVPSTIIYQQIPQIDSGIPIVNQVVNPVISESFAPDPGASANPLQILSIIASWVWVSGLVIMLVYTLISYLRLRFKVSTATLFSENIFQSEAVRSPFVLGIIKPKIYLPYDIGDKDMGHVIAHEKAHLKRKDHLIKPLAFLILSVYWFNPLLWVAYVLLCRDIELACDEKVIKELGRDERRQYSAALLNCSVNRRMIAACPLAFGEVGVKERVRSVMNYKKPTFWLIILAVAICIVTTVCFMTNPKKAQLEGKAFRSIEVVYNAVSMKGPDSDIYSFTDELSFYCFRDKAWTYMGSLQKSDITADELNERINAQEKDYPQNPIYHFNAIDKAYEVVIEGEDSGSIRKKLIIIDSRKDVFEVDYFSYPDGRNTVINVEKLDMMGDFAEEEVVADLQLRITEKRYTGAEQTLKSVEAYFLDCHRGSDSLETKDGLKCSTSGFDIEKGSAGFAISESFSDYVTQSGQEIFARTADVFLGKTVTLNRRASDETIVYEIGFIQKTQSGYAENLQELAVGSEAEGVNVYLDDRSSLDGSIGYILENRTEKNIEYGEEYTVYRITDGDYVKCDLSANFFWDAVLYMQSGNSKEYTYFSTEAYNLDKPGKYRFEKTISFEGEKEEYKVWLEFVITETKESNEQKKLEEAINAVLSEKYTSDVSSEKVFTAYKLIATQSDNTDDKSKNETLTAFIYFQYGKYRDKDRRIEEIGGGSTFAAVTFYKLTDGEFALKEYWEPRMGGYYMKDVQEKFPKGSDLNEEYYSLALQDECYKRAVEYFAQAYDETPVYYAETAYAGASALAAKEFAADSENKDRLKDSDKLHYPVVRIETIDELEIFRTDYPLFRFGLSYTADMGYPSTSLNDIPSFYEATQKYNGEFFQSYDLYLIYITESNSLIRHKLACVWLEDGRLSFEIVSVVPESTDEKELGYFITVAVRKSEKIKVSEIDAYSLGVASAVVKTYAIAKEGIDAPNFTLNNDGTFNMTFSVSDSHFRVGKYTLQGDKLTMIDNDGEIFTFIKDGESVYRFDKENSTSFHGEYNIPDGAAFEYVDTYDILP